MSTPNGEEREFRRRSSDSRPIPDPTQLTTEALHRGISDLRTLLEQEIEAINTITQEKFASVETRFTLMEAQRIEQKADQKREVEAALTAQKEAVKEQTLSSEKSTTKSEVAIKEQLTQLITTFNTEIRGVDTSIGDLKDRVGKIESLKLGGKEAINGVYAFAGFLVSVLIVIGILAAAGVFKHP